VLSVASHSHAPPSFSKTRVVKKVKDCHVNAAKEAFRTSIHESKATREACKL
jgi:hypothetical protein